MIAWGLGLLIVLFLVGLLRIRASGIFAWLLITIVPYSIGKLILILLGHQ